MLSGTAVVDMDYVPTDGWMTMDRLIELATIVWESEQERLNFESLFKKVSAPKLDWRIYGF